MTKPRTVFPVAIIQDEDDGRWRVHIDDEADIPPFFINPSTIVRWIDELAETSFSVELEIVDGLIPYLKAYDIFSLDVSPNGFEVDVSDVREEWPTGGKL